MSFNTEFKSFVQSHPFVSGVTLGFAPLAIVGIGRIVSWIKKLVGLTKEVNDVANARLGKPVIQMDDLQGLETRVTYVQRAAYEPPRSMHPQSETHLKDSGNLTTGVPVQPKATPNYGFMFPPVSELPDSAFAKSRDDAFFSGLRPTAELPDDTFAESPDDIFFSSSKSSLSQIPAPPQLNEYNIPIGVRYSIKGDGNCLYASLAVAFMGDVNRKDEVRFKIAEYEADLLDRYYDLCLDPVKLYNQIEEIDKQIATVQSNEELDEATQTWLHDAEAEYKSLKIVQSILSSFDLEKEVKLAQLNDQFTSLQHAYETGIIDKSDFDTSMEHLSKEKAQLDNSKFDPNEYVRSTATESEFGKTAEILAFTVLYPATIHMYGYDGAGNLFRQHDAQFGDGPHPVHLILQGAHFEPIVNPDASIQQ